MPQNHPHPHPHPKKNYNPITQNENEFPSKRLYLFHVKLNFESRKQNPMN